MKRTPSPSAQTPPHGYFVGLKREEVKDQQLGQALTFYLANNGTTLWVDGGGGWCTLKVAGQLVGGCSSGGEALVFGTESLMDYLCGVE